MGRFIRGNSKKTWKQKGFALVLTAMMSASYDDSNAPFFFSRPNNSAAFTVMVCKIYDGGIFAAFQLSKTFKLDWTRFIPGKSMMMSVPKAIFVPT